jgi:LacI family transcriptional regulator
MADVAREAGVSLMTVSRVVREKEDVSESTRQRVQQVIERLGYRPSGIARGLATNKTNSLGLVMPDVANPFFSDVALGAEREAYDQGYNVFLCNTEEDPEREIAILQSLEEKRVDGLVLISSRLDRDKLQAMVDRFPVVVLVNRRLDKGCVGAVLVDNRSGGKRATEHLLQAGHRAIGFLAGPPHARGGRERAQGYQAALAEAGLAYRAEWTSGCAPVIQGGQEKARDLLLAHPELTALFCYNDLVAVGALQACADLGLSVPDDLAIVGFDDIMLAALVTPPLTTCHVDRYELGAHAMRILLAHIDDQNAACPETILQPDLIVRASAP